MAILALAYIAVLRQLNASRRLQLRITESCPIEPGEVLLGLVGTDDLRSSWRLHYQQTFWMQRRESYSYFNVDNEAKDIWEWLDKQRLKIEDDIDQANVN